MGVLLCVAVQDLAPDSAKKVFVGEMANVCVVTRGARQLPKFFGVVPSLAISEQAGALRLGQSGLDLLDLRKRDVGCCRVGVGRLKDLCRAS